MEIKTIVTVIIAGMLGAVVFVGLLPVFADTSSPTNTLTNDGYFTMDKLDEEDHTLTWYRAEPKAITVDGVKLELPNLDYSKAYTIFGGNNFMLRLVSGGVQLFGPSGTAFLQATINTGDMVVEISNGTVVFTANDDSDTAVSFSLDEAYIINVTGDGAYTMKYANESAIITKDSSIITMIGTSRTYGSNDLCLFASGTIDDGITPVAFRGDTYPPTFSDLEYSLTNVSGYKDAFNLSKIDFTVTQNGEDYDITYSYFLVPTEVTAEKTIHPDGPTTALLNLLPVLIAIGLILGIAGAIFIKRM